MANQRARSPGRLAELNTHGQVSTKPGYAVDPNAGIWFTTANSLRRAGQALGNLADRAMKRQQQQAIATASDQGAQAGYSADLGTGVGSGNSEIGQRLMGDLQKDFDLSPEQAAGFVGNLAHESGGFQTLQEVDPTVAGSRGGFGYAQWTGDRRKQFEDFAKKNNLDPSSYEANYGFLKFELTNTKEGQFLDQLRKAGDARSAAEIVSNSFLRPGIPNMESRYKWADRFAGANGGQAGLAGTGRPSSSGPALALRQDKIVRGEAYWASKNRYIARRYPNEVTQGLDDLYEENKDDPAALAKAFDDYERKSLGALAQETNNDPDMLLLGQQTFMQKRRVYERSAQAAEDAWVRDGERTDYDQTIGTARTNLQKQAYLAANDEEAGTSLDVAINENLGSIETALEAGVISPEIATRDRKAILDTVTLGRIDGTFDALPDIDSKKNFVEGLKESWTNGDELVKGLSLEQIQTLERKYQGAISSQHKAETATAKLHEQKMRGLVKDDLASIRSTGIGLSIDDEELTFDQVKGVLGEEFATNWQHNRQIQADLFRATSGIDVMSASDMQAHLQGLEPKAGTSGFTDQMAIHDTAQKEAQRILKQRKEDPALAVDSAFDELKPLREKAYEGDLVAMEEMIKGRLEAQEALGISDYAKAPLTNSEALSLLAPLPDHPTKEEWLAEAAKWDRIYGPYSDEVQDQLLHSKGVPKAILEEARAYLKNQLMGNRPSRLETKAADAKASAVEPEQAMNGWAYNKVQEQAAYNEDVDDLKSRRDQRGRAIPFEQPADTLWPNTAAITALIQNPDQTADFDKAFGDGAAAYYLEKHQEDQQQLQQYLDAQASSENLTFEDWLRDQEPREKSSTKSTSRKLRSDRYQRRHKGHR